MVDVSNLPKKFQQGSSGRMWSGDCCRLAYPVIHVAAIWMDT